MDLRTYYKILGSKLTAKILGMMIVVWGVYKISDDWLCVFSDPKSLPPIVYADGAINYTLIDSNILIQKSGSEKYSPEVRKYYSQHWVLNFPNIVKCIDASTHGTCDEYKLIYHEPVYNTEANNLLVYLKIPETNLLKVEADRRHDDVLHLFLNGKYQDYDSYSNIHYSRNEIECRKDIEIVPGLFKLRDMTEDERKLVPKQYSSFKNNFCLPQNRPHINETGLINDSDSKTFFNIGKPPSVDRFLLYDGNISIGDGRCRISKNGNPANCTFTIWLPKERYALLQFTNTHLEQLPLIYKKIVKLINHATVKIEWREKVND